MRYLLTFFCFTSALLASGVAATAGVVTLSTGEALTGEVTSETDESVVLLHPVLGELTIPRDQITSVVMEVEPADGEGQAPAQGDAEAEAEAQAEAQAPVIERPRYGWLLPDWNKRFELGFTGTEGNTENNSLRAAFLADVERDTARWLFDAKYYYATTDGDTTDNTFTTGLRRDWLLEDSPWFLFAQGRYDYDQFEAWRHRATGNAGFGFEIYDEEDLALNSLFGFGVTKEFSGEREFRPEALLGLELLRWHTFDNHTLTGSTVLYPDLGELGEYRWVNAIAYSIKMDADLSLKFGIDHEYQSEVADNQKNHDIKYYGALVIDF